MLIGIEAVAQLAIRKDVGECKYICSDGITALTASWNKTPETNPSLECNKQLNNFAKGKSVELIWIAGYNGVRCNEIPDHLTKLERANYTLTLYQLLEYSTHRLRYTSNCGGKNIIIIIR